MFEIYLIGTVGAPMWPEEESFGVSAVRQNLDEAAGADVFVHLNSGGGDAFAGHAIYQMLIDYPGRVTVEITGVAASAASLIAMAGDEIVMTQGSTLMIHDPATDWLNARGTEEAHRAAADALATIASGYAEIYAARAGLTPDEARAIMRAETWLDAQGAVDAGFADRVRSDAPAQVAARFTYAAYHHAPRELLAGSRASRPEKLAVLAMIGGARPATTRKEIAMSDTTETDRKDEIMQGDDTLTSAAYDNENPDPTMAEDDMPDGDMPNGESDVEDSDDEDDDDEDEAPAVTASVSDAAAICHVVTMHGGSASDAAQFIEAGNTLGDVIAHYRQKGQTVPQTKPGPRARITRDERDTRRIGMTAALTAQFGRTAPTDERARPFKDMPLVEMAAASIGYRGSLRTPGDRLEVFMNAMHTTSDFPLSLSNALNKVLADRYRESTPIYREISREKSFKDFRPHSVIRAGDFPALQGINEAGEIKVGTIGESAETVALASYGIQVRISRQTLINDDTGAIADAIADQGRAVARFEEKTFFAACFAADGLGPVLSNTRKVFNTTDNTLAGSGAAISVATLAAAQAAIRKHTTLSGEPLDIAPKILLVSPDNEVSAQQVVGTVIAEQAANVNPFSGRLTVLSTARLTGNRWYLLTDPRDANQFIHGYLEGASAPRMRMEEPFGTQGIAYSLEHDFAAGAVGRVGAFSNPGA